MSLCQLKPGIKPLITRLRRDPDALLPTRNARANHHRQLPEAAEPISGLVPKAGLALTVRTVL
jgi:hypothetical protein